MTDIERVLEQIPDHFTDTFGWDGRKTLLDVYYEGFNADYVAGEDDFQRNYAGIIAVARYAMSETLAAVRDESEYQAAHKPGVA